MHDKCFLQLQYFHLYIENNQSKNQLESHFDYFKFKVQSLRLSIKSLLMFWAKNGANNCQKHVLHAF